MSLFSTAWPISRYDQGREQDSRPHETSSPQTTHNTDRQRPGDLLLSWTTHFRGKARLTVHGNRLPHLVTDPHRVVTVHGAQLASCRSHSGRWRYGSKLLVRLLRPNVARHFQRKGVTNSILRSVRALVMVGLLFVVMGILGVEISSLLFSVQSCPRS
jgi:hypothetical protein